MKIVLRIRNPDTRRYRLILCDCCGQPRVFSSWKQAKDWCKENGYETTDRKMIRI